MRAYHRRWMEACPSPPVGIGAATPGRQSGKTMRQSILAIMLIALPVAIFSLGYRYVAPSVMAAQPVASLGDLADLQTITADTKRLVDSGDLAGAERRITDFETAWDEGEATMRPLNKAAWGKIDSAADGAIGALRATSPDAAAVVVALDGLGAALADPYGGAAAGTGAPEQVAGIAVEDETGHAIPCEEMLKALRDGLARAAPAQVVADQLRVLQDKATERCNADDDRNADTFAAQALSLLSN